jgi:hypothetical protein
LCSIVAAFGKVFLAQKMGGADFGHLYAMKELLKASIVKDEKNYRIHKN